MITKAQEAIYNCHLTTSRKIKNKPFKIRENFSKITPEQEICLYKLEQLFNNNNIEWRVFFEAPYIQYKDQEYFPLDFYVTRRAIKCYTEYIKQKQKEDPDTEEMWSVCKEGIGNIYKYCIENNISIDQYKQLEKNSIPIAIIHLKEHKINFYVLHALDIYNIISRTTPEMCEFIIPDFFEIYNSTKQKFIKSKKLKQSLRKLIDLLSKKTLIS